MSKVFLDANVLLEIMLSRPKLEQVISVLRSPKDTFCISSLAAHIVHYFAEAEGVDWEFARRLTGLGRHISLSAEAVKLAYERYNGKDFEDCLQAACAEIADCDRVVTLDKRFARVSGTKLPVEVL